MSNILLNYAFLWFWSIFGKIHRDLFFLDKKVTISETSTEKLRNFFFLPFLIRGKSWGNLDLFKLLFWSKLLKRININKTFFLHKVSHILLNYAFLLFWSTFGEILRELFYLDIKVTISEPRTEILRKFVFLTFFENGHILRKIWICLNNCFWPN